jgi:hypothetical protein
MTAPPAPSEREPRTPAGLFETGMIYLTKAATTSAADEATAAATLAIAHFTAAQVGIQIIRDHQAAVEANTADQAAILQTPPVQ